MLQNSTISQSQQPSKSMSNEKALNAYKMYLAAKLHFMSDTYDVTKFNSKVRVSRTKFAERNQISLYEKFADKFDTRLEMAQYLIANFAYGAWGKTDIVYGTAEADQNYKEWNRRKQSLTQVFKNDLSKIKLEWEMNNISSFQEDLQSTFPRIPNLFQMFIGNRITLETLVILDRYNPFLDNWKKNMGHLFQDEIRRLIKSKPFIRFDEDKLKPIFTEFFQDI
jgi:hypothetical protein